MARDQLLGLAAEVDRFLAAGAATASASDKLRNRGKAIRELSKQVPSLVPLAESIERLQNAAPKQVGTALLELAVMTRQLRSNLGQPGAAGDLSGVPMSGPWTSPLHSRDAQFLVEKLGRSGGDRESDIEEAIEAKRIADLRLINLMFDALDDGNSDIADTMAAKGIPSLGPAVLPDLEGKLNLQGKRLDGRRLLAICKIDKVKGRDYCLQSLAEGSTQLKVQALECLPEVGKEGEAEKFGLELAKDKQKDVRLAALASLKTAKSEKAFDILFEALRADDWDTHYRACESFETLAYPKTCARLVAALNQEIANYEAAKSEVATLKKSRKKAPAAKGKGKKKEKTPLELATEKMEKHYEMIERVIEVLGNQKTDRVFAADTLLPFLQHADEDIQMWTVQAFGSIGAATPKVIPALLDLCKKATSSLVEMVVEAFDNMEPKDRAPAIPTLLKIYDDKKYAKSDVQSNILQILPKHFAENEKPIVKILRTTLADKQEYNASNAVDIIGEIGEPAKALLPDVLAYLKRCSYYYYFDSDGVIKLDPEGKQAIPVLMAMLKDRKAGTRETACSVLEDYGPKAAAAIPALEKLVKDKNQSVKWRAEQALTAIQ